MQDYIPDHGTTIIELYNADEDFRILCQDYLISIETLKFKTELVDPMANDKSMSKTYFDLIKTLL